MEFDLKTLVKNIFNRTFSADLEHVIVALDETPEDFYDEVCEFFSERFPDDATRVFGKIMPKTRRLS